MAISETEGAAKGSPWDVFIHLLAVIALYASVYAAISLLFNFIDLGFPDPLESDQFRYASIRYSLSILIIFFPAYVWAWRQIETDLAANPGKRRFWVRTCPIYLTLFLAGMLILGDLACLVYYFLGGELTARFVLKVASILVVAGAVLRFYLDALRREPGRWPASTRTLAWAGIAAVALIVAMGLFEVGAPARARLSSFDTTKAQNLAAIQGKVVDYWRKKNQLAAALDDLNDPLSNFTTPTDPQNQSSYEYHVTSPNSFQLCADFNLASDENSVTENYMFPAARGKSYWGHGSGRVCFTRKIDPDLYPSEKRVSPPKQ
jgi:hypothetical protein